MMEIAARSLVQVVEKVTLLPSYIPGVAEEDGGGGSDECRERVSGMQRLCLVMDQVIEKIVLPLRTF